MNDNVEPKGDYPTMQLGPLTFPKTAALAPMAGVADRAFREICRSFGACYTVGEMASAKGLCYGSRKTAELLTVTEPERPMAVQLFGDEPAAMAEAAKIAERYSPDAIDVNMGCPAPKVAGNGSGAALMKDLPLAEKVVRAVVEATSLPVTVKMRTGWDSNCLNAVEAAKMAEECGAVAVTVHGRTRVQMYAPPIDFETIAAVKRAVKIPVIGNGGIVDAHSAMEMYSRTGCDLVMIGQGALGRPWVFGQIESFLRSGVVTPEPALEEKMKTLLRQIRLAVEYKGEYSALREARSHAAWYLKGMRGAAELRRMAGQLSTYADLEALVEKTLAAKGIG
ncbi:MAG: tRNA dihydrouridine synthase DusB [Oscillospiraceae bacterium]